MLLEGRQLVKEAFLAENVSLVKVFCAEKFLNDNKVFVESYLKRFRVVKLSDRLLKAWSSVDTSQGIIGILWGLIN